MAGGAEAGSGPRRSEPGLRRRLAAAGPLGPLARDALSPRLGRCAAAARADAARHRRRRRRYLYLRGAGCARGRDRCGPTRRSLSASFEGQPPRRPGSQWSRGASGRPLLTSPPPPRPRGLAPGIIVQKLAGMDACGSADARDRAEAGYARRIASLPIEFRSGLRTALGRGASWEDFFSGGKRRRESVREHIRWRCSEDGEKEFLVF